MANAAFHAEVALGLREFYNKLSQTPHLSPDAIQCPPPEGWTDAGLDLDGLRSTLGRSEAVVGLLRHLPYIRPMETGHQTGQWPIFPKTKAVRYLRGQSSLLDPDLEGLFELAHLPPHMVSLTHPAGEYTLYGPQWWLVDCETGRITKYAGPPRGEALAGEFESEWKKAPTYAPVDFFQEATSMLGKDFYPIPALVPGIEADFSTPDRRERTVLYQIYMLSGWRHGHGPGPSFDREKCRRDLETFLKEQQKREARRKRKAETEHLLPPRRRRRDPAAHPAGYDRNAIVAGLTRYYETLARMAFFPASMIQRPPEGRWGDDEFLPREKTLLLGFDYRVVDLLRRLPYLDVDESHEDDRWPVAGRGEPQRYLADNPQLSEDLTPEKATPEMLFASGIFPFPERMPEGLVPIAGGAEGEWWIVDTDAGTVIVYDPGNKKVGDAPDDQPWLWTPPRPAGVFFEELVDGLYNLDLVPVPRPDTDVAENHPEIWGAIREGDDEDDMLDADVEDAREIYREHGWPDLAKFRRQECYDALVEYRTKMLEEEAEDDYGPA
ncbi:hypothetical protein CSOJ01_12499 [Colletotrichum sojae]|uniref:Uncharacterized protein n=1 Tax=Colletotrichum sojae TaxID=2175907 RepID=A0A8H6MMI3_9PEZI|nr:hypothetical protein CSOJ01_12499 [Colletotrichum sojae]